MRRIELRLDITKGGDVKSRKVFTVANAALMVEDEAEAQAIYDHLDALFSKEADLHFKKLEKNI